MIVLKRTTLNIDLKNQLGSTIMFSQGILEYFKKKGGGNLILYHQFWESNHLNFGIMKIPKLIVL